MKLTKKAAIITSVILGAGLAAAGGAYCFFHTNVEPESVTEAPAEARQETTKQAAETRKNSTITKNAESETKESTETQTEKTAETAAQTETTQPADEVTATTEKATQVAQAASSQSTKSSKKTTSQQKASSQKAASAGQKSQTVSQPAPAAQPAAASSDETSGKRELYFPQGHYEERVVKPAYTAYDVQAFEEPVMQSFCVFYDYNGNEIKTFTREESDPYTDADGKFHDPLGEYSLYVAHNHIGKGNWMVEERQVGSIHHDARHNLTQEQFDAYLATLKNQSGLVYSKGTVPAETEMVFVPNN